MYGGLTLARPKLVSELKILLKPLRLGLSAAPPPAIAVQQKRIKIKLTEFLFSRQWWISFNCRLNNILSHFFILFPMNFTYFFTKIVDRLQVRYHENLRRKSIAQMITEWLLCKVEFVNVTQVCDSHHWQRRCFVEVVVFALILSLSWVWLFCNQTANVNANSTKYE